MIDRGLGYAGGIFAPGRRMAGPNATLYESPAGSGDQPIWLMDVSCNAQATSLMQCDSAGWGTSTCTHAEDTGELNAGRRGMKGSVSY